MILQSSKKPKVLLVQPPVYDFALYDLYLKPYGLLRIGKWLGDNGYDVRFVNALDYSDPASMKLLGRVRRKGDGTGKFFRTPVSLPGVPELPDRKFARYGIIPESFEQRIGLERPELVLISSGMTYWYMGVKEAVESVKRIFPGVPIVIGGIYASLMPEHCRKTLGDVYVIEGDIYPGFPILAGKLGFPVLGHPPAEIYDTGYDLWRDAAVIRINRGCPMNCDYCASGKLCGTFSPGNPDQSFELVKKLYSEGIRNIAFYDDALLSRSEDVFIPFIEKVIDARLDISFFTPNAVHLRFINRDIAALMKKGGFRELRIGFESSSEDFHTVYDNKFELDMFPRAVEALRGAGFTKEELRVYILAGLPGQYADEVEASVMHASGFGVSVSLAEYSPVPGTALWNDSVRLSGYPLEEEPLFHNNSCFPMEWEGFTRDDLNRLKLLSRTPRSHSLPEGI